jgi:UDP-glucose 4-epimerase
MEKILITGGLGNIGIDLTKKLIELGHSVVIYDYREDRYKLFEENQNVEVILGDIRDFERIRKVAIGVTGIIHLAAVSRVVWGYENPLDCVDINIRGTANILEAARISVRKPWIVLGSSREVYGEPEMLPCKEEADKKVANIYGVTKIAGEYLLQKYCENYGLSGITLRFSNVYGSTMDQLDRVVPKFLIRASRGLSLVIQGGGQLFDFTHIDDTVDGIIKSCELLVNSKFNDEQIYDDFHILTGKATSLQDLAQMVNELFENEVVIDYSNPRSYDVEKFYGDPTKAEKLIGFKAMVDLKEGLSQFAKELNKNHLGNKNKLKI